MFGADETWANETDSERTTTKAAGLNHKKKKKKKKPKKTKTAASVTYLVGAYLPLYIEIGDISFHSLSFLLWLVSPERKNKPLYQATNKLVRVVFKR